MCQSASSASCYEQLLTLSDGLRLFSEYSPKIFPLANQFSPLQVQLQVAIFKLLYLTNKKFISVAMGLDMFWYDPNIPMNWTYFTRSDSIAANSSSVWTMNLYITNPGSHNLYLHPKTLVKLSNPLPNVTGASVQTKISEEFVASCMNMNLYAFPYDKQQCSINLAYRGTYNRFVTFDLDSSEVTYSTALENLEWRVNNVTLKSGANNSFMVVFDFTRSSYFFEITLIYPTVILQLLVASVLILPSDRGEKVTLAATLMTAIYVLQSQVTALLPAFSDQDRPAIMTAYVVGFGSTIVALAESVLMQTIRIVSPHIPGAIAHRITRFFRFCLSDALPDDKCKLVNVVDIRRNECAKAEGRKNGQQALPLLAELLETMKKALEMEKQKSKKHHGKLQQLLNEEKLDASFRRLELFLNSIAAIVYLIVIGYYFGYNISEARHDAHFL